MPFLSGQSYPHSPPDVAQPFAFLSIAQAAELLGVTTKSVRRWIADGVLPARRIGTRTIRIAASDIDAALRPIPSARGGW